MDRITPVYRTLAAVIFPAVARKLNPFVGLDHLPAHGGYILAANHVDWLDGFYLAAALWKIKKIPVHFLAKTNNYWWTTAVVQIPPDEKSTIIDHAVQGLRDGKVICNFPEGSRNPTPVILPGKTGTVRMAIEANVPVVPVGITCDYGQSMAQSVGWLFSQQHRITVAFGQPLNISAPPGELTKEYLERETQRLMTVISTLCHKSI